jgi:hypothetical protein
VAPDRVHSGVPPFCGAAVGQLAAAGAVSVTDDVTGSATDGVLAADELEDDELADDAPVSEPHAASVMTSDAAEATSATEVVTREEFTGVTLQPRWAAACR